MSARPGTKTCVDPGRWWRSRDFVQFVKFAIVGCTNFVVSFTVFYLTYRYVRLSALLHQAHAGLAQRITEALAAWGITTFDGAFANVCGYGAGILNSFFWNRAWTFQGTRQTRGQFRRFVAVNVFCIIFSTAGIFIFVDCLGWSYKAVWFVVSGLTALFSYLGYKYWVFEKEKGRS